MISIVLLILLFTAPTWATTYSVGPNAELKNIGDVPWETIAPGDTVAIHWRPKPYYEKWVICRRGTRAQPIVVRGIVNEKGDRQLDLVDSDHEDLIQNPAYRSTFVYGNVLVEGDGEGNRQIVHYGGDSGKEDGYQKGTLFFFNNTVVSTRKDRTTLFRLSTNDESCEMFNNIIYTKQPGETLSLSNEAGVLNLRNNWIKSGWVASFDTLTGKVVDSGTSIGEDPMFVDVETQNFELASDSAGWDAGMGLPPEAVGHAVAREYLKHLKSRARVVKGKVDLGAFEFQNGD